VAVSETRTTTARRRGAKDRTARELAVDLVFGPPAGVVVRALRRSRVPPTAVVLVHTAVGIGAAFAVYRGELVAGALLIQLKTLLDNADGRLARATGRVTLFGRYLDTEADLVVNALLFAALGRATGEPWLALAAFLVLTATLSVAFTLSRAYWRAHGRSVSDPPATGSPGERALAAVYRAVFGWQDRLLRAFSAARLRRVLERETDAARVRAGTLAYHDHGTQAVLANLGLSTHLLVLGVCLVLGAPEAYLWLAVASGLVLPVLQLRREAVARRTLSTA
jgi:archaetidylinositol phosphate synthase